jgi:hypothetical protein
MPDWSLDTPQATAVLPARVRRFEPDAIAPSETSRVGQRMGVQRIG